MKNKKFMSLLLAGICVATSVNAGFLKGADASASAEEASQYEEEINIVKAFGIMTGDDKGEFNPEKSLTRAEFAKILASVLRLNTEDESANVGGDWFSKYLGDIDYGQIVQNKPTIAPDRFDDVTDAHWANSVINTVCSAGYMKGVADNLFYPDKSITINEAVKTMVYVLGYEPKAEIMGGWPNGYMNVAKEIGIVKGINTVGTDDIKREEVAKLIVNALETDIVTVGYDANGAVYLYSEENKSLLNEVMKLDCIEGVITDNGITAQNGESAVQSTKIKIGDEEYKLADEAAYIRDYISRKVKLYVTDYDEGEDIALYAVPKDRSIEILSAGDLVSVDNDKVVYRDSNDRERTIRTVNMPYIIYNGKSVSRITDEMIDDKMGYVTLTAATGGNYDTVNIETYESWYISGIDSTNKKIFNGIKYGDESIELSLDTTDGKIVTIYDKNQNELKFADLTEGMVVDVCGDKDFAKLIANTEVIKDITVEKILKDDGYEIVSDGETYKILKKFAEASNTKSIKNGNVYNMYLNSFGYGAYLEENSSVNGVCAVLAKITNDDFEDSVNIKLYTFNGIYEKYAAADKVRVEWSDGTTGSVEKEKLSARLSEKENGGSGAYTGVIEYKMNSEGKISKIVIPVKNSAKNVKENKLRLMYENSSITYLTQLSSFNAKVIVDSKTKFLNQNEKPTSDNDRFSVTEKDALTEKSYSIKAYNTDSNSYRADYVILSSDLTTGYTTTPIEMLIVTDVEQTLNAYDEPATKVCGYYLKTNSVPSYLELYSNNGAFENAAYVGEAASAVGGKKVQKGDIIRYCLNNNNVDYAVICYSSQSSYSGSTEKGAIPGVANYYDAALKGLTNPIAFSNAITLTLNTSGANSFNNGGFRLIHANVYSLEDNMMTYTTQSLADIDKNGCSEADERYCVESITLPTFTVINFDGKQMEVRQGSTSDIKTYADYGSECSKVFAHLRSGRLEKIIIINGEIK